MDWIKLWGDFLKGDSSAIQAIFSILGFVATGVGILYVVWSFPPVKVSHLNPDNCKRPAYNYVFYGIGKYCFLLFLVATLIPKGRKII